MFTGRRQGRLTSSRAPRMRKEAEVLHSSLPGSIPGVDASAGGGHARRCRPHTPPPHLNTISQDVETISILEGAKRDWPANRLLGVDWSFAGLQEWPLWLGSCLESLARDGDDCVHLISTSGGGSEDRLLSPQLVPHRKLLAGPDSCDSK